MPLRSPLDAPNHDLVPADLLKHYGRQGIFFGPELAISHGQKLYWVSEERTNGQLGACRFDSNHSEDPREEARYLLPGRDGAIVSS